MTRLKRTGKNNFNFGALLITILIVGLLIGFLWIQDGYTYINHITYANEIIPRQFTGYKIAHLSNIDNEVVDIASSIKSENVDIVVVSGGLVDTSGNYNNSIKVLNELSSIVPTYFVLQEKDLAYKDQITDSTNATYLNGNGVTIQSEEINAMDYIKHTSDEGVIKEIEKGTEKAKEYLDYIESELSEDKNKTIELIGIDCYSENIYDDFDMIYNATDKTSVLTMSALGNIARYKEMGELDIEMYLAGGTYGLKNHIDGFDGTLQDVSQGIAKIFNTAGICKNIPNARRFFNMREIQIIELSDSMIYKRNPLERFYGLFVKDVDVMFDVDDGFKEHRHSYK